MKRIYLLLLLLIPTIYAAEWDKTLPAGTTLYNDNDDKIRDNNEAIDRVLANYRQGAKIEYNTASELTVTAGEVVCSNSAGTLRRFRQNPSNTSATWSDLDTGTEANSTSYYVYAVADATADTFTIKISTSSTSPSGATYYKKLGSFVNNSSGNIQEVLDDSVRSTSVGGTVAANGTIPLPNGYVQDQCDWTVGLGTGVVGGSHPDGIYYTVSVDSNRAVTARYDSIGTGGGSGVTANYIISCSK